MLRELLRVDNLDNNTTHTSIQSFTIEEILHQFQPALITILLLIILRIILSRVLSSLSERGILTLTTRATILRFIDLIMLFIAIATILQVFIQPTQLIFAMISLVVIAFILFFYELREFMAYINLQLLRHLRGRTYEIHLPFHDKPLYGRITHIDLLGSTIEDVQGRRIYVSNYLLMNSILREHVPTLSLKIALKTNGREPLQVFNELVNRIKNVDIKIFRIDDKRISIVKMDSNDLELVVNAYPAVIPLRNIDILELTNTIHNSLKDYEPRIEILELL